MSRPEHQRTTRKLPDIIPLFPLEGALLLPGGQLPLNIFEPRYLRMVDDALGSARMIGMIQPRGGDAPGAPAPLYDVGCAGRMTSFTETGDGRYLITLTGIRRFELTNELASDTPYRQGAADWSTFDIDAHKDASGDAVDREMFLEIMRDYLEAEGLKADWDAALAAPIDTLVSSLAMGCPFAPNEKQALLEAKTIAERADCLMTLMEMSGAADPESGGQIQ